MEGIVLLIISLIVGSFLNGSKAKKEPPKTGAKPFTAAGKVEPPARQPDDPLKKLKELSRDMYREIQKELQTEDNEPPSRQLAPTQPKKAPPVPTPEVVAARAVSEPPAVTKPSLEQHRGRLSAHGGRVQPISSSERSMDLFPTKEEDLLKGIIFSEILGPPKSKR
ncbi:hypothetical protein AB1K83_06515 [Sporosarcina sp. 179-K 3D1 HS]|uniref:hypothetical protein n=1 Tax=Sporosarcina sp. 179-K 3D1 HS TaxID=3232169 RepID=UPI0039A0FE2E